MFGGESTATREKICSVTSSSSLLHAKDQDEVLDSLPKSPVDGDLSNPRWFSGSCEAVLSFTSEQIDCICSALRQKEDFLMLDDFLKKYFNANDTLGVSEEVLKARASLAFYQHQYRVLFEILTSRSFHHSSHTQLQNLWYQAHYAEAQRIRGRPLGAVDKYRLRKKYPLPKTIWDGEETIYCFKEKSRHALKVSFKHNRYPSLEEKKLLTKKTGLTLTQVT